MRWVGIIMLVLGIVGVILGILLMVSSTPGFYQIGLAIILLGIGVGLGGFTLFGLLTALGKMLPPG